MWTNNSGTLYAARTPQTCNNPTHTKSARWLTARRCLTASFLGAIHPTRETNKKVQHWRPCCWQVLVTPPKLIKNTSIPRQSDREIRALAAHKSTTTYDSSPTHAIERRCGRDDTHTALPPEARRPRQFDNPYNARVGHRHTWRDPERAQICSGQRWRSLPPPSSCPKHPTSPWPRLAPLHRSNAHANQKKKNAAGGEERNRQHTRRSG